MEVGQTFGLWEILTVGKIKALCRCDCGIQKRIRINDLQAGKSRMCRQCSVESSNIVHGMRDTAEYNSWMHMIQRCHNENNKDYANYGGRGIIVCDMWRKSFEAFFMCVGLKPTSEHTIERIDTNGNYEPGNVKWATRAEQTVNQRSNVVLEIDGERKTVSQWAQDPRCPVNQFTIYKRLERDWDARRAVFEPSRKT
jgi:hypothetical protein